MRLRPSLRIDRQLVVAREGGDIFFNDVGVASYPCSRKNNPNKTHWVT